VTIAANGVAAVMGLGAETEVEVEGGTAGRAGMLDVVASAGRPVETDRGNCGAIIVAGEGAVFSLGLKVEGTRLHRLCRS